MIKYRVVLSCWLLAFALATNVDSSADEPLQIEDLVVTLIDSVDVASAANGIVSEVAVREGQRVQPAQTLAKLDDRQAKIQQALAQTQLDVARWRASNDLATTLAEKQLVEKQQHVKQHDVVREIANEKASNEVRVSASRKSEAVAKNELDRALHARQQYADSVSASEIEALRLTYEKSRLETEQAAFERRLDQLQAKAETEASRGFQVSVEQSEVELAQTVADKRVAELQVTLQEHQRALAELSLTQHTINSPIAGVVVELFRKPGDWVNPGDAVVRVIRLDRLRAQGFVPFEWIDRLRENRAVNLTIHTGPESTVQRNGTIVFINPEIDPVSGEIGFWVEFDNASMDVLPGMRLQLRANP